MLSFAKSSKQKGDEFESKALSFLQDRGFVLVDRNFNTRFGEIDLIVKKDDILHFVEVKGGSGFEPILNLTPNKLQKIIKAVNIYLSKKRFFGEFVIDAIIIKDKKIEFLENITM
jgi:putative endonuclease